MMGQHSVLCEVGENTLRIPRSLTPTSSTNLQMSDYRRDSLLTKEQENPYLSATKPTSPQSKTSRLQTNIKVSNISSRYQNTSLSNEQVKLSVNTTFPSSATSISNPNLGSEQIHHRTLSTSTNTECINTNQSRSTADSASSITVDTPTFRPERSTVEEDRLAKQEDREVRNVVRVMAIAYCTL